MHAIKGSWVGQTFALAKLNDSGGKRTRIRRSKEERKTMVESFIKKYQNLNNGSFPSLNLTHKEVGGSFYTVRELVREVIQENRVLGPAKLTAEDNNTDIFSEQYPLGSISVEPQIHVESSQESHTVIHVLPNHHQDKIEELPLNSSGKSVSGSTVKTYRKEEAKQPMTIESQMCLEGEEVVEKELETSKAKVIQNTADLVVEAHHQMLDNGKIVNGSIVEIEIKKESDQLVNVESQMCLEGEEDVERELETSNDKIIQNTADVVVEAQHPMLDNGNFLEIEIKEESDQPVDIESQMCVEGEKDVEKELEESTAKVTQMKTDIVVETFPLRPVSKTALSFDGKSDETLEGNVLTDSLEISSCLANEKVEVNLAGSLSERFVADDKSDTSLENVNGSTTKENVEVDVIHGIDDKVGDGLPAGNQPMNAPNDVCAENLNNTNTHDSLGNSISEEAIEIKNKKPDIQHGDGPSKIRDPTLDRINLESWEAKSKKSGRPETNPLLEIIKAFVAAFVKFWSE